MIEGGSGGHRTNETGLAFERDTDLGEALLVSGFRLDGSRVYEAERLIGRLVGKRVLYAFLEELGVDADARVSSRLLPDEAFYAVETRLLTIVEKKWQQVAGSVDEKLQTCGFKIRQYRRLFAGTGVDVQYLYVLNDWFTAPKYLDVLEYIRETGADYFFGRVPLESLGLQTSD